jgi:hypothetical protein
LASHDSDIAEEPTRIRHGKSRNVKDACEKIHLVNKSRQLTENLSPDGTGQVWAGVQERGPVLPEEY